LNIEVEEGAKKPLEQRRFIRRTFEDKGPCLKKPLLHPPAIHNLSQRPFTTLAA
jgi:hypothetical protein